MSMDWLLFLLADTGFFLNEAMLWFQSKELTELLRIFWVMLFLEIPRYLLTDIYSLIRANMGKPRLGKLSELSTTGEPPLVSIIVPALNEERLIDEAIVSLLHQDYPNFEIVVVDDGSQDNTANICAKHAKQHNIRFFPLGERQGKSAALNYGITVASGDYLMFIDSDTSYDRSAISRIMRYFNDPEVGAVSGNFKIRNQDTNFLTHMVAIEYFLSMSMGWRFKGLMGLIVCVPGWFGLYQRSVVSATGLFEPGPGNDSDLTIKTRKIHKKIVFAPDAMSLTDAPVTWAAWIRQRMRWSRNLVKNRLRRHRDVFDVTSSNFSLNNLLAFLDNIFFLMVVPVAWVIYLIDMGFHYGEHIAMILFINVCLHLLLRLTQYAIALTLSERKAMPLELLPYLFFYGFYMAFYKLVRVIAYIDELVFRGSYRDKFAPPKVQKQMTRY